jgi:hypothetical protein
MLPRVSRYLVALLVAAPLLGGCKHDKPAPAASGPDRAAWVAAANAICADVAQRTDSLAEPKQGLDYADFLQALLRAVESGQARLRALVPPPADKAVIESNLLAPNDAQIRELRNGTSSVLSLSESAHPDEAKQAYDGVLRQFQQVAQGQEAWERSFGLTACAG